jgi:hypothetical protein
MPEPGQALFVGYTVEPDSTLPKNTYPIINQIEQAAIGTPNGQTQTTART